MYSTCLFCNESLGTNEALEHFPVGRRLAYDAKSGRLWVVCSTCARWNLSPFETRWEAIEEAERAYRDTKRRVATGNIGLARVRDGTELVRIGAPLRPEFAAWRYGDRFGTRWRKQMLVTSTVGVGGTAGSFAAVSALAMSAGMPSVIAGMVGLSVGSATLALGMVIGRHFRAGTSVRDNDGNVYRLTRPSIDWLTIRTGIYEQDVSVQFIVPKVLRGWRNPIATLQRQLKLGIAAIDPYADDADRVVVHGETAMAALSTLLPSLNSFGASSRSISSAVGLVESQPSATTLMLNLRRQANGPVLKHLMPDGITLRAANIPVSTRLALEMSLHEEDERRAMDGELEELERRWREADEIAKIADGLLVPEVIQERINSTRGSNSSGVE